MNSGPITSYDPGQVKELEAHIPSFVKPPCCRQFDVIHLLFSGPLDYTNIFHKAFSTSGMISLRSLPGTDLPDQKG